MRHLSEVALEPDGVNVFLHPLAGGVAAVSALVVWLVLRRSSAMSSTPDPAVTVRGC